MRLGIEHFFATVSGYAYLGHAALLLTARKNGAIVRQRPVDIARVFAADGSTPPVRQSDARRAWRRRDMRLWATQRALPLNEQPKHWPTDGELAARAIIALDMARGPVDAFVGAVLGAVWARDLDIADRDVLAGLLTEAGVDAKATLLRADSDEAAASYESNTQDAIAAGVFGSPTYRIGDELFFGQDRLEFVQAALERAASA